MKMNVDGEYNNSNDDFRKRKRELESYEQKLIAKKEK